MSLQMTLEEAIADVCDAFDATVIALEREALEEAERDDDAQAPSEFGTVGRAPAGEDVEVP